MRPAPIPGPVELNGPCERVSYRWPVAPVSRSLVSANSEEKTRGKQDRGFGGIDVENGGRGKGEGGYLYQLPPQYSYSHYSVQVIPFSQYLQ